MTSLFDKLTTGHVGLNVRQLSRSLEFYIRTFGFDVAGQSEAEGQRFAFLAREGQLVLTLWEQATRGFDKSAAGLHHLAFQVESREEIESLRERLRADGVTLIHDELVAHRQGADSGGLYFEDPDGTRLEVYTAHGLEGYPAATEGAPSCGFF